MSTLNEFEEQVRAADGQPIAAEGRRKFHFKTADEICSAPYSTQWLVDRYFERNKVSSTFGEPGSGKSFVALDVGLSIAADICWHGRKVTSGPVFYIAGEGFGGLRQRLKAWSIEHEVDLSTIPFFVSDRPASILDGTAEVMVAIDELIEINGNPCMVILDTLNRNFGPGDENSTTDMTAFVSALDTIRTRYACHVSIVHHSGLTASDRSRGSSALRGALDQEYRLVKNPDGTRTLICTKSKDHDEPEPLTFELHQVDTGWTDENGNSISSCVLRQVDEVTPDHSRSLRGTRRLAYDCLLKLGGDAVDVDEWRLTCYEKGISPASSTDAKRKAIKRAVSELRDSGFVFAKNDLWFANRPDTTGQMKDYNDLQDRF